MVLMANRATSIPETAMIAAVVNERPVASAIDCRARAPGDAPVRLFSAAFRPPAHVARRSLS